MDGTLREWYKRVWAHDPGERPVSRAASPGTPPIPSACGALPWADAILDSEYPMQDPITVYPRTA